MAVIMGNEAHKAARNMLLDVIRHEMAHDSLSSTSEMLGYILGSLSTAERYNVATAEPVKRRIAAPEFLTGLLRDDIA